MHILGIVFLLIVANASPLLVGNLLGQRADWRVDGGKTLGDGRPLFGATKTWRGLFSSLLLTGLAAWLLGFGCLVGLTVGAAAMAGDLLSSFIKRRLGMRSSAKALGLDQLPEALLPALLLHFLFDFSWTVVLVAAVLFAIVDIAASPLLFRLGWRRQPH